MPRFYFELFELDFFFVPDLLDDFFDVAFLVDGFLVDGFLEDDLLDDTFFEEDFAVDETSELVLLRSLLSNVF